MMNRKRIELIFFIFFVVCSVYSEETKLYVTLEQAINLALKHSYTIKEEHIKLNASKLKMATAWTSLLPQIDIDINLKRNNLSEKDRTSENSYLVPVRESYNGTSFDSVVPKTATAVVPEWSSSMTLSSNFLFNPKTIFDIQSSILNYEEIKLTKEQKKNFVIEATEKVYLSAVSQLKQIEIISKYLEKLNDFHDRVLVRYGLNKMYAYKINYVETEMINLENILNQQQDNFKQKNLELKQLLGLENYVELILDLDCFNEVDNKNIIQNVNQAIINKKIQKSIAFQNRIIMSCLPTISISYNIEKNMMNLSHCISDYLDFSVSIPLTKMIPFNSTQRNLINTSSRIQQQKIEKQKIYEQQKNLQEKYQLMLDNIDKNQKRLENLLETQNAFFNNIIESYSVGYADDRDIVMIITKLLECELGIENSKYEYLITSINMRCL